MKTYFRLVRTTKGRYYIQEWRNWGAPDLTRDEAMTLLRMMKDSDIYPDADELAPVDAEQSEFPRKETE